MPAEPGSYLLVLRLDRPVVLTIGRLGTRPLEAGWHVYAGSARRGLRARLAHHLRPVQRPRWHVDHLRQVADLEAVWVARAEDPGECALAGMLAALPGAWRWPRFGSSDCRCPGHLVSLRQPPPLGSLFPALRRVLDQAGARPMP